MTEDLDVQVQAQTEAWDRPRWLRATYDNKTGEQRSYEGTEIKLRRGFFAWLFRRKPKVAIQWSEYPHQLVVERKTHGYRVSLPNGTTILRKNL